MVRCIVKGIRIITHAITIRNLLSRCIRGENISNIANTVTVSTVVSEGPGVDSINNPIAITVRLVMVIA